MLQYPDWKASRRWCLFARHRETSAPPRSPARAATTACPVDWRGHPDRG